MLRKEGKNVIRRLKMLKKNLLLHHQLSLNSCRVYFIERKLLIFHKTAFDLDFSISTF